MSTSEKSLIIRMVIMSTKIWWPYLLKVEGRITSKRRVWCNVNYTVRLTPLVLLLDVDICSKIHSYTDSHDVDEDLTTVYHQGGDWTHIFRAGITERFISTDDSFNNEYVASSNAQNIELYGLAWCRRRYGDYTLLRWWLDQCKRRYRTSTSVRRS